MLHAMADARVVGIARIVVFGTWFLSVAMAPTHEWSHLPRELFAPIGVLRLLPDAFWPLLLQQPALIALRVVLAGLCLLLTLGVRPHTPIALVTCMLILLFDSIGQSFGDYLFHAGVGLLYSAFALAIFPAADGLSIQGPTPKPASQPLYAAAMLIPPLLLILTYMFIGTNRIVDGGYIPFVNDSIVTYLGLRGVSPERYGWVPIVYPSLQPLFKLGFAVATAAEILSPLALVYRRFRWVWLLVILPFHVGTVVFMDILFWQNMILIVLFLTELPYLLVRRFERQHIRAGANPAGTSSGLQVT